MLAKLTVVVLMSSLPANAHEVVPTIADVIIADGDVNLTLQINLEAFLVGVDMDAVQDTNDAPQAQDYDALRALSGEKVAQRASELIAGWNALPMIQVDGVPIALNSMSVDVPDDVSEDLPRIARWRLTGATMAGTSLVFSWPPGGGDVVLRQQGVDDPFTGLISGGANATISMSGGDAQSNMQSFFGYIPVGFDHILPKGLDHILFVLGLFFLSTHLRPLVWQVSAFTLAHTVTLAMGALGVVTVPASIVEPLIAASIVYVAVENIFTSGRLSPWRPVVIFCFGLLHGLGFASVLGEFGLPAGQFVPALIGFNIGVEFGQLTVIAIAFVLVGWAIRKSWYRTAIAIPASCVIAAVGAYWVIERTLL